MGAHFYLQLYSLAQMVRCIDDAKMRRLDRPKLVLSRLVYVNPSLLPNDHYALLPQFADMMARRSGGMQLGQQPLKTTRTEQEGVTFVMSSY